MATSGRGGGTGYPGSRIRGVCCVTGAAIAPGSPYVAALIDKDDGTGFERLEYSLAAWDAGNRPGAGGVMVGHWRGVVPDGTAPKKTIVDDATILDLFEQLGEQDDPRRQALRWVLGLLLIRRKVFACEESRGGVMKLRLRGQPRPPEGPALIVMADPGLSSEDLGMLAEQIQAVMAGDVDAAEGNA